MSGRGPAPMDWDRLGWPAERLDEAVAALARRTPAPVPATAPGPGGGAPDAETLARRLQSAAEREGLEAIERATPYPGLDELLRRAAPALVVVPAPGGPRLLAVTGRRGSALRLRTPDGRGAWVPRERVRAALCAEWEENLGPVLDALLPRLGLRGGRSRSVRAALLEEQLHAIPISGVWTVRRSVGGHWLRLAVERRLPVALGVLAGAHATQYALWLAAWTILGRDALRGSLAPGTLLAWGALVLATALLRALVTWTEGRLSLGVGGLLKERLMLGAVRLLPEEVRHLGAGQHLSRVMESEAAEMLGFTGALMALMAVLELAGAAWVLSRGVAAPILVALLLAWAGLAAFAARRLVRTRRQWTRSRLDVTHLLVERMSGHETRLGQQAPERWFDGEDEALALYLRDSRRFDRVEAWWGTVVTRGWLILGLAALAPAFAGGAAAMPLAVALGGVLLAYQALARLAGGLGNLAGAWVSWEQVRPLWDAAARTDPAGIREAEWAADADAAPALVAGADVGFRYPSRGEPVLRGCTFSIARGERVLLDGPSGGGKSTLVSLLSGLRRPGEGTLLLEDRDMETLGREGWRRRVAAAPQFHENHVFTDSFAFNLLMGRRWPPRKEDLDEATRVCRELGLGGLLERMPGGIHQAVGETGWHLSHGERSRLFLARALLQGGDLLVLDESFGTLDPENLRHCLTYVLRQPSAVVVVGHR